MWLASKAMASPSQTYLSSIGDLDGLNITGQFHRYLLAILKISGCPHHL